MAEIGFYHLIATPLERALPRLLERARAQGHRIVVRAASEARARDLDALLWRYDEASFLAHGTARDGNPRAQPIWLTDRDENPNGATMLVLVDGVEAPLGFSSRSVSQIGCAAGLPSRALPCGRKLASS